MPFIKEGAMQFAQALDDLQHTRQVLLKKIHQVLPDQLQHAVYDIVTRSDGGYTICVSDHVCCARVTRLHNKIVAALSSGGDCVDVRIIYAPSSMQ